MSNYKAETNLHYKKLRKDTEAMLPDFCKTYFIGKEAKLAETTAASYAYELYAFFTYLCENNSYFKEKGVKAITLDDLALLKTKDIEEYLHYLRYREIEMENGTVKAATNKEGTVSKNLSAISSLYTFFIKRGQLSFNPTSAIERQKKQHKKPIVLENDEQEKLFDSVDFGTGLTDRQLVFQDKTKERDRAIFQVLLDTGIRVSELVGIDTTDINFEKHYFTVIRKRSKVEDIYFSDETQTILIEYLDARSRFHPADGDNALFLSSMGKGAGKRMSVRSVQQLVKKYMKSCCPERADVMTPHKMRSTFGTQMLRATGDLELVSELLGHDSLNTTKIYAQYNSEKKEKTRNILSEGTKT